MKPPFRRRTGPSRFQKSSKQEQTENDRSFCKGWDRKDLKGFLQALKEQQNFESELDLVEIQKNVPQRSLKEIEGLIKSLKSRVLQKLYLQVQSQKRKERKAKVPIETWGNLIQKISRSHEKTISTAFSQMLVIAATEPCGLMHSEPPHPIIQTPAGSSLHPVQSPKTPSLPSNSSLSATSTASLTQPDSGCNAVEHINKSPSVPTMPETPTPSSSQMMERCSVQLQSEAAPTMSSPISTGPVAPSVSSNKNNPVSLELLGHDYLCKPRLMKCVVNFDKIYRYLSDIESQTCNSALTSMECAVLLDVLMCLPEELPLLDCKELQHHLLQIHTLLSKPTVMPASSSNTDRNVPHADTTVSTQKRSTGSAEEPSSESPVSEAVQDWALAELCGRLRATGEAQYLRDSINGSGHNVLPQDTCGFINRYSTKSYMP